MSTTIGDTDMAGPPTPSPLVTRRPGRRVIDAAAVLVGLGFGACIALAIEGETKSALSAHGGWSTFLGRLFGLTGTYLMLVMLLLISRIPPIERAVGQDRLVKWHRNLGQWPVYLLVLHAFFITLGYAEQARTGFFHQGWILIDTYPDVLMAVVALGLIILAAVLSIRQARRKMRYETWWSIHLYLYLALALAVSHQIANGEAFVGHPLTRAVWAAFWIATAGTVFGFRIVAPALRTWRHDIRVETIRQEAPGVVSVVCSGRHLEKLGARGGQFFEWRFLRRGLWWHSHPFSLSATPRPPYLRFTVKVVGEHTQALARLTPGTRIAIEGPYGSFTNRARTSNKALLVGAGVGVTPIRSLLEDLDPSVDVVVLTRASRAGDLVLRGEISALVQGRNGTLRELVGSRREHPLDANHLASLVPDVSERDVYICGPDGLNATVIGAARQLGVPEERIHCEQFSF